MKQITKDVKSKGVVVDTIKVPEYENIDEALKAQTPVKVLAMVNKVVSDSLCNASRTAKVRPTSDSAQLARMAKADPKVQKEIEELLKKYQS